MRDDTAGRIRKLAALGVLAVLVFSVAAAPCAAGHRDDCLDGDGRPAEEACRRALEAEPGDLKLLLRLGELLEIREDYDGAVTVFRRAAAGHPDSGRARSRMEMALSLQEEKAWIDARKTGVPEAPATGISASRARLLTIRCRRLTGERGLTACDEALQVHPGDAALHFARGSILASLDRTGEAGDAWREAVRLDPENESYVQALAGIAPPAGDAEAEPPPAPAIVAVKTEDKAVAPPETPPPPATPSPRAEITAPQTPKQAKVVERMVLLKALLERGLIEREEFDRRKKGLLDEALRSPEKEAVKKADGGDAADIEFGRYHALVIGIQGYRSIDRLQTAERDALTVGWVLQELYDFKVKKLIDVTRRDILLALGEYRRTLHDRDNLLIYYAGHGWLDNDADTGYWLPVDSAADSDVDWLSLDAVTAAVRAIPAKHVMIVADSCYSGKLTRGLHIQRKRVDYLARMATKRTRVVLTSGGLEPVLDSGGSGGHSVFASAFLAALKENEAIMEGTTLFTRIRRPVMLSAEQTPEYSDIRKAGHEGGDFLFVRRR